MDERFLLIFFKKEALSFLKKRNKKLWGCPRSGVIVTVALI